MLVQACTTSSYERTYKRVRARSHWTRDARLQACKACTNDVRTYEKIENIKPQNYDKLIADLEDRTGMKINRAEVGKINFLRDTAEIKIFYDEKVEE